MSMVLTKNIDEFGEDDGDAVHALGSAWAFATSTGGAKPWDALKLFCSPEVWGTSFGFSTNVSKLRSSFDKLFGCWALNFMDGLQGVGTNSS